jgi:hypothetical protein
VRDAGAALDAFAGDLLHQLGHAGRAAGTLEAIGIDGDAAGVITAVLQALQALDQDGNDVAGGNRADDAAHDVSFSLGCTDFRRAGMQFAIYVLDNLKFPAVVCRWSNKIPECLHPWNPWPWTTPTSPCCTSCRKTAP